MEYTPFDYLICEVLKPFIDFKNVRDNMISEPHDANTLLTN